jgi:hypothetical protein
MAENAPAAAAAAPAASAAPAVPGAPPAAGKTAAVPFNGSTPISSLDDLKEKAPELYNAIMQSVAMNIVNDMNDAQQRLKELQDKERQDSGG